MPVSLAHIWTCERCRFTWVSLLRPTRHCARCNYTRPYAAEKSPSTLVSDLHVTTSSHVRFTGTDDDRCDFDHGDVPCSDPTSGVARVREHSRSERSS